MQQYFLTHSSLAQSQLPPLSSPPFPLPSFTAHCSLHASSFHICFECQCWEEVDCMRNEGKGKAACSKMYTRTHTHAHTHTYTCFSHFLSQHFFHPLPPTPPQPPSIHSIVMILTASLSHLTLHPQTVHSVIPPSCLTEWCSLSLYSLCH